MLPLLPLAWVTGLKALWTKSRAIILIGLLCTTHFVAFTKGMSWEAAKHLVSPQAANKQTKKAVVQAQVDTRKLSDLEAKNDKLLKELDELNARSVCVPTDDELRILREIQAGTATTSPK